jgi:hypothetical protein
MSHPEGIIVLVLFGVDLLHHHLHSLQRTCTAQDTLEGTQTKVVVGLRRKLVFAQLEEQHHFAGQLLCATEALGVEHDLTNQTNVRLKAGVSSHLMVWPSTNCAGKMMIAGWDQRVVGPPLASVGIITWGCRLQDSPSPAKWS